jgi:hypothetical protein
MSLVEVLEIDKAKAIEELAGLFDFMAEYLEKAGWSYVLTDNAPESFAALKLAVGYTRVIPVANYGMDKLAWSVDSNVKLRFWHDYLHLYFEKGFGYHDEKFVIDHHLKCAELYGCSEMAIQYLNYDMHGQNEYYRIHKDFVSNQDTFLDSCMRHGLSQAVRFKH